MNTTGSEFLGYPMFNGQLGDLFQKGKTIINTLNQYSFCIAEEDKAFKSALMSSDVLLPDGISIVLSAKFLNGNQLEKIAGADLHDFVLKYLNNVYGSCFYLGSKQETLDAIQQKLGRSYPNISHASYSPPFRDEFSEEENEEMIARINEFCPDVLFVGMTAPKQEKWVHANRDKIQATYICTIGAVFDFYSETIDRPSDFWVRNGLEWFGRFIKEPKRLWRRYLLYGGIYVKYIVFSKLTHKLRF
ncbi:WecB/TagA/CpsF family glycosyltransferase [Algoriphagus sp. Y33]|uniref:WecB/TagA/CpsF family glycosyltransferase n=1 Tax=Algoriphagus sp. Y33 TaxID=2772483 RepID=UPI00177CE0C4|nr:WecB/TagA/CpsF family glycosyltransferase [Algoriphagus sp. Y33]